MIKVYQNFGQIHLQIEGPTSLLKDADVNSIFLEPNINYEIQKEKEKVIVLKNQKEFEGDLVKLEPEYVILKSNGETIQIFDYLSISRFQKKTY